ncbi:hypothetical protein ACFWP5_30890, partial [Streptomyces sp. NPDC058469]
MAVDQLPGQVREFANYLDGLLARLDQGGGWCGVFWQRDPDGMQACLGGREVPPWDVVEALLQDLAAEYGHGVASQEKERARALHAAALAAFDARPGSRDALSDRLDVMLREQKYAAERQAELGRLLNSATTQEEADALRLDLAWAHDDHERATARCTELRARIERLDNYAHIQGTQAIHRDRHGNVFRVDDTFQDQSTSGYDRNQAPHRLPRQRDAEQMPVTGPQGGGGGGYGSPGGADGTYQDGRTPDARRGYEEFERANPGYGNPDPTWDDLAGPDATTPETESPDQAEAAAPTPKQRKRRRGSARFAGLAEDDAATTPAAGAAAAV